MAANGSRGRAVVREGYPGDRTVTGVSACMSFSDGSHHLPIGSPIPERQQDLPPR